MNQQHQYFMQNSINSDKSKKIVSLFRTKGNDRVNPFDYLNQYCKVKMALIIESIYI